MNTNPIKRYLQEAYTDERLASLLAHTEDGKLSFASCCCFIGIATSDHALKARNFNFSSHHYTAAKKLDSEINNFPMYSPATVGQSAEQAFLQLGRTDEERGVNLLPMIREEIERREGVRSLLEKWGKRWGKHCAPPDGWDEITEGDYTPELVYA